MRVLIACEYSGTVATPMAALGHEVMTCDLLETETPHIPHHQGDVFDIINNPTKFYSGPIDLMVAHPPCTYLTNAANGSLYATGSKTGALVGPARWAALIDGATFFRRLLNAPIPRVAIENPRMNPYARKVIGRNSDQSVQPWQFGEPQSKEIRLWLRGLPPLVATEDVRAVMDELPKSEAQRVFYMSPGAARSKERSRFFPGVAAAMAEQWAGSAVEAVA